MAALTDLSDVINRRTGGNSGAPEDIWVYVDGRIGAAAATAPVAGRYTSLWSYNKNRMGSGAIPSTSAVPTNATNGTLAQTNPAGGAQKWLVGSGCSFNTNCGIMVYDRLVHSGGLSGVTTTAQTTNLPTSALTRYTSGEGNFIFVEISALIGTTTTTATIEYTNQDGTTGRVTPAFTIGGTGLREAQRFIIVPLADGDTGVRAIANLDLVATTGTAGDIAVGIGHPINFMVANTSGGMTVMDHLSGHQILPEVMEDAALAYFFLASVTTVPSGWFQFSFLEKA